MVPRPVLGYLILLESLGRGTKHTPTGCNSLVSTLQTFYHGLPQESRHSSVPEPEH